MGKGSNKVVLITGASGFIGRALLKKLSKGKFDIIAGYRTKERYKKMKIANKNITYLRFNLANKNDFKKITKSVDIVIHLAAQVFRSDKESLFEDFLSTNVLGTYNLLEFCREKKVERIIYISTKYVYGQPEIEKVDETCPTQPSGKFFYYGRSKLMGENLCRKYSHDFGLKSTIFRLSHVFGIGQEDWFLIPRLIKKVKNNQKITLYGNGSNIMEYLYIDDCVKIIIKSLDSPHEGIYNVGPGKPLTFKKMVDKILKIYSNNRPIIVQYESERNHSEKSFVLNIEKAKKELRFRPIYSFEDGLNKLKQIEGI